MGMQTDSLFGINDQVYLNTTDGNVGIGQANPTFRLDVKSSGVPVRAETTGTFDIQQWVVSGVQKSAVMNTGGYWQASDATLKENINNISDKIAMDVISQLRPVEFDWKPDTSGKADGHSAGFIAQEVVKVLPLAATQSQSGIWGVTIDKIIPYIISSVQLLNKNYATLAKKVEMQQQEIDFLKQEIELLKAK